MLNLQSIYFGQKHKDFDYKDFEVVKKIKRLATQHQRQACNSCNGYGIVKGQMYYSGQINDYARREYGPNVKSSYISDDVCIFDKEMERIEDKIKDIISSVDVHPIVKAWKVEFQGDPRGATVKLSYEDAHIEL